MASDLHLLRNRIGRHDFNGGDGRAKLRVVPDAWGRLLTPAMVGSDTRSPGPRKRERGQAVRDATEIFGNDDYCYGCGRPKLCVAKYVESDVLPQVPHAEPTKRHGAEYFRGSSSADAAYRPDRVRHR